MIIRKATKKDIPEIIRLSNRIFYRFEELSPEYSLNKKYFGSKKQYVEFETGLREKNSCVFVAEIEKNVVGVLMIRIESNWPMFMIRKKGNFDILVVDSYYRKKGVGKRLMKEGYKWFKEKGVKNFSVTTHASDEKANNFWKHMGFTPYSIRYQK